MRFMTQLAEQVKVSLEETQKSLREALGFASKTETSQINIAISQLLMGVEQVLNYYNKQKDPLQDLIRRHLGE